ncbi:hypothetical protein Tco_1370940 [Tanacetum coccineum]
MTFTSDPWSTRALIPFRPPMLQAILIGSFSASLFISTSFTGTFVSGSAGCGFLEKFEHFSHPTVDLLALLENDILKSFPSFGAAQHVYPFLETLKVVPNAYGRGVRHDIIAEFCGPFWWKELSKESCSKILLCGDGSCWKAFKPISSLIAKTEDHGSEHPFFVPTDWLSDSKMVHVVPYGELDGIPVALVARFGVVS